MGNVLEVTFDNFKCVEKLSQFYKDSIENYEKDSDLERFLQVDIQYFEKIDGFHNKLLF